MLGNNCSRQQPPKIDGFGPNWGAGCPYMGGGCPMRRGGCPFMN